MIGALRLTLTWSAWQVGPGPGRSSPGRHGVNVGGPWRVRGTCAAPLRHAEAASATVTVSVGVRASGRADSESSGGFRVTWARYPSQAGGTVNVWVKC